MRKQYHEIELYRQIARHLNEHHPDVEYHFDLSGLHNPSRATRGIYKSLNGSGWPDLVIAQAVSFGGTLYGALFLELKAEGVRIKKRDGSWASEHIAEQAERLRRLAAAGNVAQFAIGLEEALVAIDSYLGACDFADGETF